MKEPISMSYLNFRKNYLKTKTFKYLLLGILLISLTSCYSVKKRIGDPEVYLYKDQASYMDGTYFIDPYRTNGNFKLLTEIFDLKKIKNIDKVDFKFVDDKHLEISYTDGLQTFTKTIEGKMKNGAFRYKYTNLPIGIPLILFSYQFKVHQIALGNDDNIIITEYGKNKWSFYIFKHVQVKTITNRYYFDRQLK